MKKLSVPRLCLFFLFCLALNIGGKVLATRYELPLWLDCLGTVLCAYAQGPYCGAMVGITGSLLGAMAFQYSPWYAFTGMAIGLLVGFAGRKKHTDTLYGALKILGLCIVLALVVSLPLNYMQNEGLTGNKWGDGVISLLRERGFPVPIACFLGQLYLEFPDKALTMLFLYAFIRAYRGICSHSRRLRLPKLSRDAESKALFLVLVLAGGLMHTGLLAAPVPARASAPESEEAVHVDYNDYVQTIFSSKNGLPCGEANAIAQTNDGILWVGTYAGLYRYNGQEFRWMNEFDTVRNVNTLFVDEEGRLWIGTNDNGLSVCIHERISDTVDSSSGLPSNSVRSIIQSTDGYYYIGTTSSMQVFQLNNGLRSVNILREINYADNISADSAGHVATITTDGRLFLLKKGQILSSRQIPGGQELYSCCCFDRDNLLLAGTTKNQVQVFDVSGDVFQLLGSFSCEGLGNLKDLVPMESGEIFVTSDSGIGYMDPLQTFHIINTNNFNASIDNMLLDYQGNLWFTSSRLGLLRMAPSSFRDLYATAGLDARVVNTTVRWGDTYYFGTDKGLDAVDLTCRQPVQNTLTEHFSGVRIRNMLVDSANHLWICTYGSGLVEVLPSGARYLYDRNNGGFGNRVRLVYELSDGSILAGGDTGISWIRNHRIVQTIGHTEGLINSMILTFTELADGTILAGTDGDGIAVLENGKVSRMLTREDGLSSEVILRSVADPKGEGVFLVTSNGLCFLSADGSIRPLKNFPYFNNYDIFVRDEDTLFVLSSAGIYVVARDDLLSDVPAISYDLLDSRQGLNSALTANSWTFCNEDHDLFLACDTGVFVINAMEYTVSVPTYRMMIPELRLDNTTFKTWRGSSFSINRNVTKVEILPEILNYSIQDPYVGYYLDGFDNEWTVLPQSSLSSIVYTNLAPGQYTFHLGVFDNSGQNMLAERLWTIIKENAFYDTLHFHLYLFIIPALGLAVILLFFLCRFRLIQERKLTQANQTIQAIAATVDAKDDLTSHHSQRVAQYAWLIAQAAGLKPRECEHVKNAALMHDIGKIGIPDDILKKHSRLTDTEYAIMKGHTVQGAAILKDFTLIPHVAEGAEFHHERYDGKGYPKGLKGEEIPQIGRIIGVADAFDAMTANRVYRKKMDVDYVFNELKKGRGTQFDPKYDDILLHLIENGTIDLNKIYAQKEEDIEEAEEKNRQQAGGQSEAADEKKQTEKGDGQTGDREEASPMTQDEKEGEKA